MLTTSDVKCLLVDDLEENLFALEQVLRRDGLRIVTARSGAEALEALLVHEFALAIVDVHMPEMDGIELAELMRGAERTRRIPIIFVTAGAHERRVLFRGYETGAVDFLYKPIEPIVLRNKAETFFELYRQREELARQLEERERLTRRLAETLRLNEMFVAAVGHDLRNPLLAVTAGAQLIARRSADADIVRLAEAVTAGGKRMQRMTGALFDLTRARLGGGIPIVRGELDLRKLAERVFAEQELASPGRSMAIVLDGDLSGSWDGTRLEQVLSNLLGNAIQHGAPDVPVRFGVLGSAERVVLEVRNGGVIPEPIRDGLFDPFHDRGHDQKRTDGLGLGLFIVQQIALAHGGWVDFSTNAHEGTVFRVHLPRRAGEPSPD